MLKRDNVERESEALRLKVRNLDDQQRKLFYTQFKQQIRDPDTYAGTNFLFIAGLHHFYLKRYVRGCFNLALFAFGVMAFLSGFVGIGIVAVVGICIIELPALFRSQIIIEDYNNHVGEKILAELTHQH